MTIDLTPRNIRNAILIGFAFGVAVTFANSVVSEVRYAVYPPFWMKPNQCTEVTP